MREADETIERLLAGLRAAEPSAGMQLRIHKAVEGTMASREAAAAHSRWRPLVLGPAIAMLLVCVMALLLATRIHQPRILRTGLRGGGSSQPEAVTRKPPMVVGRMASPVRLRRPHAGDLPPRAETQVASYPAPPLPLTEQEKLLLRLAHRGDAEEMAILIPEVEAAQSAKATEQFQKFFGINAKEMRSEIE
jgi:hypothetical protein